MDDAAKSADEKCAAARLEALEIEAESQKEILEAEKTYAEEKREAE